MKDHQIRRLYMKVMSAVIAITGLWALLGRADAQSLGSLYTSTAEKDCRVKDAPPDGSVSICPGKAGLIVVLTEADARQTVSIGRNPKAADNEPAASQSFRPFNSTRNTVEWRIANGKPFAIIQRWHISDNEEQDKNGRPVGRNLLVVTRLPPGPVCHVAYIDARANPNPNDLARKAADQIARGFRCGKDEVKIVGESGRATELARH